MPVRVDKGNKTTYPMQLCPVIKQLALLRKKWMLPLLLELFSSLPKIRFSRLQRALNPITPKLLTQRLAELEKSGFVLKKKISHNEVEYSLTKQSESLRTLTALLKKHCIRHATSAKTHCTACSESTRCAMAYG
ncbi:helix-turn-helix transcriptional regulator [Candidatus Micrarchaeota archaeon]|nr:helix-turn-helix transcriptional regulator [Candidatus Micrarchaeota archaeon]